VVPNPNTGLPTVDPFLWQKGETVDLEHVGAPTALRSV
jgi:hypothetical protein